MSSKKKYSIITGASRGIGLAITRSFLESGMNVIMVAQNAEYLQGIRDQLAIEFERQHILSYSADLSLKSDVDLLIEQILEGEYIISSLVNNAGVYIPGKICNEADGNLEKLIATNLYSAYWLSRGLVPLLINQRHGHIFNISSVAGIAPYPNGGSYSISKYALTGFSQNLREELREYGIKVTSIYPGAVYTDSWSGSDISPDRIIPAEDIGNLVVQAFNTANQTLYEEIIIKPTLGDL